MAVCDLGRGFVPIIAGIVLAGFLAGCSPSSQFSAFSSRLAALPEQLLPEEATTEVAAIDADQTEPAADVEADADAEDTGVAVLAYAAPERTDADRTDIDRLIDKYASLYSVPASLVHKVVRRESTYNPNARNGVHRGLMQLNPATARTMGFRGEATDLYDPDTNLRYGVKYLAGA